MAIFEVFQFEVKKKIILEYGRIKGDVAVVADEQVCLFRGKFLKAGRSETGGKLLEECFNPSPDKVGLHIINGMKLGKVPSQIIYGVPRKKFRHGILESRLVHEPEIGFTEFALIIRPNVIEIIHAERMLSKSTCKDNKITKKSRVKPCFFNYNSKVFSQVLENRAAQER